MSSDVETGGPEVPVGTGAEAAGAPPGEGPVERRGGFTLPSAYTILFGLIVLTALATWIIPAGRYALDADGSPVPGTYEEVPSTPSRIVVDAVEAPINGLYGIEDPETGQVDVFNSGTLFGAIDVALFILVIGGFIAITMRTGAIQAGIALLVRRLAGHERWMIPILMAVFAVGGTTFGMAEESLAFYVLVITVMIAAGYDAAVGALVILLGAGIGVLGSTVNPFATGIASGFADVPLSDGLALRLVLLVVGLAVGIWFVLRYADRVQRDPTASIVYDMKEANERQFAAGAGGDGDGGPMVLTSRHKVVLALFGGAFLVMVYGVIPWEDLGIGLPTLWWWFPEMTASFLLFAILIGLIGRMGEGELTSTFVDGARDLLGVALIIGIARGITVVMNNGQITDTVLHWAEDALGDVGEAAFAVVMYVLFLPLSFLIPSSSGLATVAMPIMAPLADFAGADRSLVVTAYQSASGLLNLVTPTSAVVMGGLAIARVPYGRYLRFVWPLLAILAGLTLVVLTLGAYV
ncbi:MAG TPA: YfcC family protein [Acidimicrobiales bacterium]